MTSGDGWISDFGRVEHKSYSAAGADMLSAVAAQNGHLEDHALFARLWQEVLKHEDLFAFRQYVDNRFKLDWRSFVFEWLAGDILDVRAAFRLKVEPTDYALCARLFADDRPVVLLSIHSEVELAMTRVADQHGRATSFITRTARPGLSLSLYDFDRMPAYIARSSECLFTARSHARQGRVIQALVDFTLADPVTGETTVCLGTTMFTFARRIGARLVFAYPLICDDAIVRVELGEPERPDASIEQLVDQFRQFLSRLRPECALWMTENWAQETGRRTHAVRGEANRPA